MPPLPSARRCPTSLSRASGEGVVAARAMRVERCAEIREVARLRMRERAAEIERDAIFVESPTGASRTIFVACSLAWSAAAGQAVREERRDERERRDEAEVAGSDRAQRAAREIGSGERGSRQHRQRQAEARPARRERAQRQDRAEPRQERERDEAEREQRGAGDRRESRPRASAPDGRRRGSQAAAR